MVNKQVVLETIKRMRDSGLDNADIAKTLRDIGISDNEVEEYLLELEDSYAGKKPKPAKAGEGDAQSAEGRGGERQGEERDSEAEEGDAEGGAGDEVQGQAEDDDNDIDIAEKTALRVKEHLDRRLEEDAMQDAELQNRLDSHSEKLEAMHENVQDIHGKIASIASGPSNRDLEKRLADINERLSALEAQVNDLKALSTASKALLAKILETDRRILGEKD
ncbi:MAG: hypothetical protein HY394_01450 [Candidatus Diapherotrites archaeon]|nr:hypothetical protein [Candidatus Diapherotrites archaeon]